MLVRILLTLSLLVLAGCAAPAEPVTPPPAAEVEEASAAAKPQERSGRPAERPAPSPRTLYETDCYALILAAFLPSAHVEEWLPTGWRAQPVEHTMARGFFGVSGVGAPGHATGHTLVALEAHACGTGKGHAEAYVLASVEPPADFNGPEADLEFFEAAWAGPDPFHLRRALGWPFFGDHVQTSLQETVTGWGGTASVYQGGQVAAQFSLDGALTRSEVPGGLARSWRNATGGLAVIDFAHQTEGIDQAVLYQAGPMLECDLGEGSLVAKLFDAEDCQEAHAKGYSPVGVVLALHEMTATFNHPVKR